jgi:hypothetical protein
MCPVSNTTGSVSYGETSWEDGDTSATSSRKKYYQDLIYRANTVPLIRIFKYYGLPIDIHTKSVACPFKSHKGGKEHTPSFHYYPDTNSFNCYGCHTGGRNARGCEFVAAFENISRVQAAQKILSLFSSSVDPSGLNLLAPQDFSERLEIMMDFANTVRVFRQAYTDEKSHQFIEGICWVYDQHNRKRKHSNEALRSLVDQLKDKITSYKEFA